MIHTWFRIPLANDTFPTPFNPCTIHRLADYFTKDPTNDVYFRTNALNLRENHKKLPNTSKPGNSLDVSQTNRKRTSEPIPLARDSRACGGESARISKDSIHLGRAKNLAARRIDHLIRRGARETLARARARWSILPVSLIDEAIEFFFFFFREIAAGKMNNSCGWRRSRKRVRPRGWGTSRKVWNLRELSNFKGLSAGWDGGGCLWFFFGGGLIMRVFVGWGLYRVIPLKFSVLKANFL